MGILVAREGYLLIGASVEESDKLQAQTEAARSLSTPLNFSGIEDLRGIVAGVLSGNVCTVTQLCAVKKTLSSARHLHDQVQQGRVLFV
jgi:DNA mismatch repair protein MutS2